MLNLAFCAYLTDGQSASKLLKYFSSSNMSITPGDFFQRAAEEARGLLGAGAGLAADAAAAAIKAPDLTGPIPDLGKEAARGACRRYGANPSGVSGRLAAGLERVCRPYLDDIGGSPAGAKVPFRGGQCVGTTYRLEGDVKYNIVNCSNGGTFPQTQFVATEAIFIGPIVSITGYTFGSSPCGPNQLAFRVVHQGGAQTTEGIFFIFNPVNSVRSPTFDGSAFATGEVNGCGNPPPVIVPPRPTPNPGPFPFPYNPSPDIDIDIDIDFGPDGDINIDFGTGPISIDPFGDGGGGGSGGGGGGAPGSGLPPGDIGAPGAGGTTAPGGDAEGDAPPNSVLVGLKVNILAPIPRVNEYDPAVLRGVAYVYMGTPGNLALDPAGVAMRSGQFFFAPLDNLTSWRVSANVGFVLQVIPYYRALEAQEV